MKQTTFIGLTCIGTGLFGQTTLPYQTGFDNQSEQEGWVEVQLGSTEHNSWSISQFFDAPSSPNSLFHSYTPTTATGACDNWFISPEFDFSDGAIIDSVMFYSGGMSVPSSEDTIAIYLIEGDQDPSEASKLTPLIDYRDWLYLNDYTFHSQSGIGIPKTSEKAYIGLRYLNSECNSAWLSVGFDNLSISSTIPNSNSSRIENQITIQILEAKNNFKLEGLNNFKQARIYNINGALELEFAPTEDAMIMDANFLSPGMYLISFKGEQNSESLKIMIR